MKIIYKLCFFGILFFSFGLKADSQTIDFSKPDSIKIEQIHENAKHYKYIYKSVPWNINVVEADITGNKIFLSAVKGMDKIPESREKTSKIAGRKSEPGKKVLAAINADFFYADGECVNNQITEGEFVKGIHSKKSQFAYSYSNKPSIGIYNFLGSVSGKKVTGISIDACNTKRGMDSIVIYNHYWGAATHTGGKGVEYQLIPIDSIRINSNFRAVVTAINDSNSVITGNDYILSCSGNACQRTKMISLADTINVMLGLAPGTEQIKELLGGLPQIVKEGINISSNQPIIEGASEKFSTTRHPRTAIGFDKDKNKLILVTVDGRQKISAGMSLKELSEFMIFLGCYEALNFDGGGSTTMVINGQIVNSPSDALGERSVGNSLLLLTN